MIVGNKTIIHLRAKNSACKTRSIVIRHNKIFQNQPTVGTAVDTSAVTAASASRDRQIGYYGWLARIGCPDMKNTESTITFENDIFRLVAKSCYQRIFASRIEIQMSSI